MNRRDILKAGATAAAATSVGLADQHVHLLAPDTVAQAALWKPAVFTPAQNETVVLLSELIIPATDTPGAKAANVNRYIDLFLSEKPAEDRDQFLNGLKWLDEYSTKEHGGVFAKLEPAKQIAVLEKLDTANDSATEEGTRFFRQIKTMTSRIYYQTQIGFKELNKQGIPSAIGCKHEAHNK
jgi:Gluconate 2-dehydrogenase subunit 3/TAT (twin-arginine translocation) pathway signal sequence